MEERASAQLCLGREERKEFKACLWRMLAKVRVFPQGQAFSKVAGPLPLP